MANIWITEFTGTTITGGAPQFPPAAMQHFEYEFESVQSKMFREHVVMIRVNTDDCCSIVIGSNPKASFSDTRMTANSTEFFGVAPGQRLAVIKHA